MAKVTHRLVGTVRVAGVGTFGPGDERKFFTSNIPKKDVERLLKKPDVFQPREDDGLDDEDGRDTRATGGDRTSGDSGDDVAEQTALDAVKKSRDVAALRTLRKDSKYDSVKKAIDDRIAELQANK